MILNKSQRCLNEGCFSCETNNKSVMSKRNVVGQQRCSDQPACDDWEVGADGERWRGDSSREHTLTASCISPV